MAAAWPVNKWKARRFQKWKWIILIALNLNIKGSKALSHILFGADSAYLKCLCVFLKNIYWLQLTWENKTLLLGLHVAVFTYGFEWQEGGVPKCIGIKTSQGLPLAEWTNLCMLIVERGLALWPASAFLQWVGRWEVTFNVTVPELWNSVTQEIWLPQPLPTF